MIKEIGASVTWSVYALVLIFVFYNAMTIFCPDTNSVAHNTCQNAKNSATTVFVLLVGGPPVAIILSIVGVSSPVGI
ncbi:MAG TPA: hypothetical protein VEU72_03355 [Nitrosopumilaceae archaeon]|nr:hypothetical protein [Nitrosopumilaceae archaeon]